MRRAQEHLQDSTMAGSVWRVQTFQHPRLIRKLLQAASMAKRIKRPRMRAAISRMVKTHLSVVIMV